VEPLAVGSDGTIYATVNLDPRLFRLQAGGTRWEPLSCLPSSDIYGVWVRGIDVVVGTGGMAVLVMTTYDGLFVSHDGGASRDRMEAARLPAVDFSYPLPLLSADFAENGVAYIVVDGRVYRSDDGDSWAMVEGLSDVVRLVALAPGVVYEWNPDLGRAWTVIGHCDFGRLPYWASPRFDADTMAYVSTDGRRSSGLAAGVDCACRIHRSRWPYEWNHTRFSATLVRSLVYRAHFQAIHGDRDLDTCTPAHPLEPGLVSRPNLCACVVQVARDEAR